jgi:hypothetical protein
MSRRAPPSGRFPRDLLRPAKFPALKPWLRLRRGRQRSPKEARYSTLPCKLLVLSVAVDPGGSHHLFEGDERCLHRMMLFSPGPSERLC